jgi:cation diffusion facilitator family transporter
MASEGSAKTVAFAIAANGCIAALKFIAAAVTGSSAMVSEGIHSLVDTGDGILLYVGIRRGRLPPDEQHPFGHGKEVYFWTLVVAILVFAVGGGMSVYEGITHLFHPRAIENPVWSYAVLGGSMLFEGLSWTVAWRQFRGARTRGGVWTSIERSKDPTAFTVLFEDSAALVGLTIAAGGVTLGLLLHSPVPDAIASMLIGLVLMATAALLVRATLRLLVGESADREIVDGIRAIASGDSAVARTGRVLTVHFGPHDIVAQLELVFDPRLGADDVARAIDRMQRAMRERYPDLKSISVEAESLAPGRGADSHNRA